METETLLHLFEEIEALPDRERRAVVFVAKHHDLLVQMCREERLSGEKREALIADAIGRDDMIRLAIVLFEMAVNQ